MKYVFLYSRVCLKNHVYKFSLYLLSTSDIPASLLATLATFADETALLAIYPDPIQASAILQNDLSLLEASYSKWRIKVNESKSTFRRRDCDFKTVFLNGTSLPQCERIKYLGETSNDGWPGVSVCPRSENNVN